jgi:hypothetical protein
MDKIRRFMEKIRTLTIEGQTFQVSNLRGILNPGKFEGEKPHAVRDYCDDEDDSFGDSEANGYFSRYYKGGYARYEDPNAFRYYRSDSLGFFTEIDAATFEAEHIAYAEQEDRAQEISDVSDQLDEAKAEETGPCDSCNVSLVSCGAIGANHPVRVHEEGCPRYARLKALKKQLSDLEDY